MQFSGEDEDCPRVRLGASRRNARVTVDTPATSPGTVDGAMVPIPVCVDAAANGSATPWRTSRARPATVAATKRKGSRLRPTQDATSPVMILDRLPPWGHWDARASVRGAPIGLVHHSASDSSGGPIPCGSSRPPILDRNWEACQEHP